MKLKSGIVEKCLFKERRTSNNQFNTDNDNVGQNIIAIFFDGSSSTNHTSQLKRHGQRVLLLMLLFRGRQSIQ